MTKEIIKRLFLKIFLFQILLLLVGIALSSIITSHFKHRLGSQLAAAFRNDLIMGDTRKAMLDLPKAIRGDFAGVQWTPAGASQAFTIPENAEFKSFLAYNKAIAPLYFDERKTSKSGELEFYYYRWMPALWALLVWSFLFIISIPLWLREKRKIELEYTLSVKAEIGESHANLAAQVAHDIRSPVYALDAALKNMTQLPERQRVIVRHAINRIRDVANGLLEKNRQEPGAEEAVEPPQAHLLSSLIDPVVTEKRLQFESKPDINLDFELTRTSYGLFAKVQASEFRRVISNLINNAVEALGDKGAVNVVLSGEEDGIVLTVTDNGKGIPPEILSKLGQRGETHGKMGGSGLGLFHARTSVENWGGTLMITSAPGNGTSISIKLPRTEAPAYFVEELWIAPGQPVIVLDDDTGIHQIWRGRFESAHAHEHGIEVAYFSTPEQLQAWVEANHEKASKVLCLFDYELSGHQETGISLAEELGLCAQAVIVTSRSEESRIIKECARLKLKLIPKSLSGYVPIVIKAPAPRLAVLLDDDALTHITWEMAAVAHGVGLTAFTKPDDFFAALGTFPKDIPLYIDSDLGENVKGEEIATQLKEKGFINICLATAHPPEKFAHLPWLKVITKTPPWT